MDAPAVPGEDKDDCEEGAESEYQRCRQDERKRG